MFFPDDPVPEDVLFPYNPVSEGDMGKRHIHADAFSL